MLGAKAAIIVSLVVWRGLESPTYLLILLLVLSDSLVSLGMTIIFHLGSKTPERPLWINLTIFLICLAVSLVLTRKLLTKSSNTYRVRTIPANAWSMARR
jgi:membrane protein implicated in regulation of membrane protease activity